MPNCTEKEMPFSKRGRREVDVGFNGGDISSDRGLLLLRQVERRLGLLKAEAEELPDPRSPLLVKHKVEQMLRQRVFGLCQGYEDLNGALDGTHAETLVLPYADGHAMKVPAGISDSAAITLSCNLPSAVIANELANIQVGETVAVIGCEPTGLMAMDIALHRGPGRLIAVDALPKRLAIAAQKSATTFDSSHAEWKKALEDTGGRGFDKVIEMVGLPETLQMSLNLVRPGGTIAALGVFCDDKFNLNLADVFLRDITPHMNGFANVQPYMWEALRMMERGVVKPEEYFSHTFALSDIDQAFATFFHKTDGAMKVLIQP